MGMSALDMTTLRLFPHRQMGMEGSMEASWGIVAAMWWVMMIAMMMPSATPLVLLYSKVLERQAGPMAGRYAATSLLMAGYLVVWLAFAVVAATLQKMLEPTGHHLGDDALGGCGPSCLKPRDTFRKPEAAHGGMLGRGDGNGHEASLATAFEDSTFAVHRCAGVQCLCSPRDAALASPPGAAVVTGSFSSSLLSTPLASLNSKVTGIVLSLASGAFRSISMTW